MLHIGNLGTRTYRFGSLLTAISWYSCRSQPDIIPCRCHVRYSSQKLFPPSHGHASNGSDRTGFRRLAILTSYVSREGGRGSRFTARDPKTPIFSESDIDTLLEDDTARIACHSAQPFRYLEKGQWEAEPSGQARLQSDPSFHCSRLEQAKRAKNGLRRDRARHSGFMGKPLKVRTLPYGLAAPKRDLYGCREETPGAIRHSLTSRGAIVIVCKARMDFVTLLGGTKLAREFHHNFEKTSKCVIDGRERR